MLTSCGTLFKVAPLPANPPADLVTSAMPGGLEVSASALTEDNRALAQFGANLPLAGFVAVEVRLSNRATEPIKVGKLKFELRDSTGGKYRAIKPEWALGRLLKFYGKGTYLKESYRQTRESFEALALALDAPLAPQEERRGFLFFDTKREVTGLSGLALEVKGGAAPIKLQLN
jgi:hypothetical protein